MKVFVTLVLLTLGVQVISGRSHPLNLVRICQGDTTHLACPNNEVLSISDAMYGRTVSGTVACAHRSVPKNVKGLTCKGAQTKQKVQSMCEGKPKCSVTARDFTFGNPCKGIYKHLDIEFYCAPSVPEPSPTMAQPKATTSDYSKQLYQEIFRCTKLYTEILDKDPEQECPALKAYKDCLTQTEITYPESVEDINRAMPTLDSALAGCTRAPLKPAAPKMMICKNHHYKPPCMNITGDMSDLKTFNNKISSIKVFSGYWQLYTEPNYLGSQYQIPPGYAHPFLSFLSPDVGKDITLSNDDLSSLRPIEYSEYIDTATDPTDSIWRTHSERPTGITTNPIDGTGLPQATPSVSAGRSSITQHQAKPVTKQQYSRWINLDDVDSQWPNMCTEHSCLLGVRILYPRLESMSPDSHQTFEKMIIEHIKDIFDILPEQLVLVEMVEKTSELIIEIIDMNAAPSVASIATKIEDLIKSEKLSVTVNGRLISPLPDRFGVMLKTVDENMIPKHRENITPIIEPIVPSKTPEETNYSPAHPKSKGEIPNSVEETRPYAMLKQGQTLETEVEEEQLQRKLILTVAATVSLLVLVGLVIIVSISVMRRRQSYTLISKAPSQGSGNVYIVAEAAPAKKGVEGFENPSYMLDEVDM